MLTQLYIVHLYSFQLKTDIDKQPSHHSGQESNIVVGNIKILATTWVADDIQLINTYFCNVLVKKNYFK